MPSRRPLNKPVDRDLSDLARPGWSRHMTLQEAAASVTRLARYDPGVVAELPDEASLHVEVNGVLAGVIRCLPDAPAELAVGWAFMHGFFGPDDPIDSVTVYDRRVSIMVETREDPDRRRVQAVGWEDPEPRPERLLDANADDSEASAAPFVVHADVLIDLVRQAVKVMARDGSRDGYVHVAATSDTAIHCVARDRTVEMAVAKVLGWMLRDGRGMSSPILVVRGMLDQAVVQAAGRLGVSLLVTSGVPTADAFRAATGREISILGMATNQRPGILVDSGHIIEDEVAG